MGLVFEIVLWVLVIVSCFYVYGMIPGLVKTLKQEYPDLYTWLNHPSKLDPARLFSQINGIRLWQMLWLPPKDLKVNQNYLDFRRNWVFKKIRILTSTFLIGCITLFLYQL